MIESNFFIFCKIRIEIIQSTITKLSKKLNQFNSSIILISFYFFCIIHNSQANVIFQDDFNSELHSRLEWVLSSSAESSMVFPGSGVILNNNHPYQSLIALHSFSKKPEKFSINVKIRFGSPGSGIFFNVNRDNLGRYNGYAVVISYDKAELIKFYDGTFKTIASHSSPFIKTSENVLSINKDFNHILIFCNGYYLYSVKENELPPGDCAIMIQPTSSALFSDFEVNSQLKDSLQFPLFSDEFKNLSHFGWKKTGNGAIQTKDSALNIVTGSYQSCFYGLEYPLRNFSVQVLAKYKNGNDTNLYGLYINYLKLDASETMGILKFGINKTGESIIINKFDSVIFSFVESEYSCSKIESQPRWDTLKLIQQDQTIKFYLNSKMILQTYGCGVIGGVGIFSLQSLEVSFDNFKLTCNEKIYVSTIISCKTRNDNGYIDFKNNNISRYNLLGQRTHFLMPVPEKSLPSNLLVGKSNKKLFFNPLH